MSSKKLTVLGVMLAISGLVPAASPPMAAAVREDAVERRHSEEIEDLGKDLEKSEDNYERIFLPVTVLI
ncbi:MAG TPA: hypothetical protein VFZ19_11680, partial [Solirubrobacterales bacterium]